MKLKSGVIVFFFFMCLFSYSNQNVEAYRLPCFLQKSTAISIEKLSKSGFTTHLSTSSFGVSNPGSFSADVSMSWDESNFYFLANINDDSICFDKKAPFWKNDGIELFLSKRKGTNEMVQYLLAPDLASPDSKGSLSKMDYRTGSTSTNPAGVRVEKQKSAESHFLSYRRNNSN